MTVPLEFIQSFQLSRWRVVPKAANTGPIGALGLMPRFIALLRGVNVGKGNRVPMADFRAMLEDLGYTEVRTLLNSGNAVFTSTGRSAEKHAASIQSALEEKLGVSTPTIVKSATELGSILRGTPMVPPASDHSRFFVAFAQDEQGIQALVPLQAMAQGTEVFTVTRDAAYLHCSAGVLESKVGAALLGKAGKASQRATGPLCSNLQR